MSLILLDVPKVDIPEEFASNSGFAHPFAQYSHNMPKPPMKFWAGSQYGKNGIAPGSIFLTIEGEAYVSAYDFKILCEEHGQEKAIETVTRDIEILPKLWQWAIDIRRRQEFLVGKISVLLPGLKIIGLENQRYHFWEAGFHSFSEIRSWIEFLKNKGIDLTSEEGDECDLDNLVYRLRSIWDQTEEQKEKRRKSEERRNKKEKDKKEKDKKEEREEREFVLSVLRTNGLL